MAPLFRHHHMLRLRTGLGLDHGFFLYPQALAVTAYTAVHKRYTAVAVKCKSSVCTAYLGLPYR